jgi:hypothetical protein
MSKVYTFEEAIKEPGVYMLGTEQSETPIGRLLVSNGVLNPRTALDTCVNGVLWCWKIGGIAETLEPAWGVKNCTFTKVNEEYFEVRIVLRTKYDD